MMVCRRNVANLPSRLCPNYDTARSTVGACRTRSHEQIAMNRCFAPQASQPHRRTEQFCVIDGCTILAVQICFRGEALPVCGFSKIKNSSYGEAVVGASDDSSRSGVVYLRPVKLRCSDADRASMEHREPPGLPAWRGIPVAGGPQKFGRSRCRGHNFPRGNTDTWKLTLEFTDVAVPEGVHSTRTGGNPAAMAAAAPFLGAPEDVDGRTSVQGGGSADQFSFIPT